jgi:hypothetical protein
MAATKKLMRARIELQGTQLKKSGHNKFAGYSYFELGDFLPTIQNIFNRIGLCGVVSYSTEYATLTITDTDDGSAIVITSPLSEANLKGAHPIQNLGAVETYQRRYLWMTAMEIVEHDVLDSVQGNDDKPKAKPEPKPEKPPEKMEGKPGPWQLSVSATPGNDPESWIELIGEAVKIQIGQAASATDVTSIFTVNREIFNELKSQSQAKYDELMAFFKAAKAQYK